MNVKLSEKYEIETAHPASHYGAGVLVATETGEIYGPADFMPPAKVKMFGSETPRWLVGDAVVSHVRGHGPWHKRFSREEVAQVAAFLSQDHAGRFALPTYEQLEKDWAEAEERADRGDRQ